MKIDKCVYCSQRYCQCGANGYAVGVRSKTQANIPDIPGVISDKNTISTDNTNNAEKDSRKEYLLQQIKRKNRLLFISLFVEIGGGILMISALVLGLTKIVNLAIAQPVSYTGLFIMLVGLHFAAHYDDSE